jgi:hypothetical protein
MTLSVDVWLRGSDSATTQPIEGVTRAPREWVDDDVRLLLEGMLRAMDRCKRPGQADRDIALRGLSWIVSAYEEGGVLIAIEITLGAAIAGPFDLEKAKLEAMIARVLASAPAAGSATVH